MIEYSNITNFNLSVEDKFLLECLRDKDRSNFAEISSGSKSELNWKLIAKKSTENGISQLLFKKQKLIDLPIEIAEYFKKQYYATLAKNTLIYNKLDEIISEFRKEDIELVLLKGCLLAETVYNDIGQRPMGDFDILIEKKNLEKSYIILTKLGYKKLHNKNEFIEKLQLTYNYGYVKDMQLLELHWDLLPPHCIHSINIDDFFSTKQKIKISNSETYMFAPEFLLIHLCLHLSRNFGAGGVRLCWYVDIKKTSEIFKSTINWDVLLEKSNTFSITNIVLSHLFIAYKYFDTEIPAHLFANKNFNNVEQLFLKLYSLGVQKKLAKTDLSYYKKVMHIEGFLNKIRFLMGNLFPSVDYIKSKYSIKSNLYAYFFYPIEIFLLIKKVKINLFKLS
ncbi:MAG: nucleotidyltransferase family protein [Bacteroidetes bacterium]|jgi:hypothetical protein|nr:nucleotidyltransferase family protein [Bacteroidota bacterium]MBT6685864.1 nucleotidyltransferase family protein [Bacteroidota bacterium]